MTGTVTNIPEHVSKDVVVDFDYAHPPGLEDTDVYSAWHRLHEGPDIIWTPHNGGHWIVTRAEDIQFVQRTYEIFSHEVFSIPPPPQPMQMPPVTADPPEHSKYRALINPAFTRASVEQYSEVARELTKNLIEELRPKGGCEFVEDFAYVMPVTVFLRVIDLPLDQRSEFVKWARSYVHAEDAHKRQDIVERIIGQLSGVVKHRMENRGDDLISKIILGQDKNRFESERELLGMVLLVFLGGLDTVANLLSFTAMYLARHPEHRRRLIEEPEILPVACEEIIRRHGLSNTGRLVKKDSLYKGIQFKAGDMVMVPIGMSSMDDRMYDNPLEINFDRPNAKQHNTFGNGPHTCPGAQLARSELSIFLTEWLAKIPDFHITEGEKPETQSGMMNSVVRLPLSWNVA